MKPGRMIQSFTDRFPYVGPVVWVVSLQYFIAQVVVALAWTTHYSILQNVISDLGNTACGPYSGRIVCSPLHGLMNTSFIVLGITMAIGSTLIYREFREQSGSFIGFGFMGLAGLGTILVGLFPENTIASLHFLGALLPFLIGNIGLVVLARVLDIPKNLRSYTLISGVISLVALAFFESNTYLGFGPGGMERIVAYPQTIWLIIFGFYMSKSHLMNQPVQRRK